MHQVFKKASCITPMHDICREFKLGELGGHCFFRIICRQLHAGIVEQQVLCAQRNVHFTESPAPPYASHLQCSVNFWKQKLINSFNYCL